jgi:hypothetical protein
MTDTASQWVREQIDFRIAGADRRLALGHESVAGVDRHFKRLALLHAGERRFDALNGLDRLFPFDAGSGRFTESSQRGKAYGRRLATLGNMAVNWGLSGAFLSNWCDAAGWNYRQPPVELQIPVLQHSRRKSQRGTVVLMPIDKPYYGLGSVNLPRQLTDQPFRNKRDGVVWRGRLSGTLNDWDALEQVWAESIFGLDPLRPPAPELLSRYQSLPRLRLSLALANKTWVNAGLTLAPKEKAAVVSSEWLSQLLSPVLRNPLTIEQQLQYKFVLAVPGNDIASGIYWAMLSNSVVMLVDNEWEAAFDAGLTPWVHYVPVPADADGIEAVYEQLRHEPERCEAIVEQAHRHMRGHCNPAWRDAADLGTLLAYQACVLPSPGTLDKRWSTSEA